MRRRQEQTTVPGPDPGPFVLAQWLERLPPRFAVQPEWYTRAEHERHRRSRAYVLYLGARRAARALGAVDPARAVVDEPARALALPLLGGGGPHAVSSSPVRRRGLDRWGSAVMRPDPAEARLAQLRSGGPGPLEEIARRLIADRPDIASALGLPDVIAGLDTAAAEEPHRG